MIRLVCLSQHFLLHFSFQTIKKLELSNNQIGDEGAHNLADAIGGNTVNLTIIQISRLKFYSFKQTLKSLDFSNNNIGDEGVQYLTDAFKNSKVNIFLFHLILFCSLHRHFSI
jgi:Ran GTPase-activating protein (RanGAP) involved in mRNA processing and transport